MLGWTKSLKSTLWIHINRLISCYWNGSWINPKADLQALVSVRGKGHLVVAFVSLLTKIGQCKGTTGHTANLRIDLCVSHLSTKVELVSGYVAEIGVACKATRVASVRVGEGPLAPCRGVPRGLQQRRLTLAKEQN